VLWGQDGDFLALFASLGMICASTSDNETWLGGTREDRVSRLPCERGAAKRRAGATMRQDTRVLVVDDDAEIREIIATTLKDDGYSVDTASNGAEALRKANQHQPRAVILEVMMPVMDGWEFLAQWRTRPAERRAPVLVVSAVGNQRAALEAGAQAYLSKPFDLETLGTTLASVL
jgi:CheY-like chemotaxis protein